MATSLAWPTRLRPQAMCRSTASTIRLAAPASRPNPTPRRLPVSMQAAEQSNANSQERDHDPDLHRVAVIYQCCFTARRREIEAGIEDVEVSVEQDQEDIDQENESEQDGSAYATAYADYVDVDREWDARGWRERHRGRVRAPWRLPSSIRRLSRRARAPGQSNSNSQTASTDRHVHRVTDGGRIVIVGDDLDAGIEDVEVEVDQDQEDIDQENRSEQFGVADAYASSEHVKVESDGEITAGDFVTGIGDGIDAESSAVAVADLDQTVDQDNTNSQSATTNLSFTASGFGAGDRGRRG